MHAVIVVGHVIIYKILKGPFFRWNNWNNVYYHLKTLLSDALQYNWHTSDCYTTDSIIIISFVFLVQIYVAFVQGYSKIKQIIDKMQIIISIVKCHLFQKYHNFLINCRSYRINCVIKSCKIALSCENKDAVTNINIAFGFQNDQTTDINRNTQSINHPFSIGINDWQRTHWGLLKHIHMYRFQVMYHFCTMRVPCKNRVKTPTKSMQKQHIWSNFLDVS